MVLRRSSLLSLLAALALGAALAGACGDSTPSDQGSGAGATLSSSSSASSSSSSGTGGGGAGGAPDCYTTPTTYVEIINACTSAQQVDVSPVLPLLEPDGGLPPLP